MKICDNCGNQFPNQIVSDGRTRRLGSRRFCPDCSALDANNRRSYVIALADGEAFCARCGRGKPKEDFHLRADGSPLSYCKSCSEEAKRLKFEEKVEKAVAERGGACADCGGVFPVPALQFAKGGITFPLGKAKHMSWDRLEKALEGHELLCLNCGAMRRWVGD